MVKSGIYRIINIVNNKIYIGSSRQLRVREQQHLNELINNKHGNQYLQNSWNKYGEDNFRFEVIEYVKDIEMLFEREQHYIDSLDVCNREKGYNISNNARVPILFGKDNPNFGKKFSKDHCKKISNALKKNNYMKGRSGDLHPRYGAKASEETRKKISDANRRRNPESYDAVREARKKATRGNNPTAKENVQLSKEGEFIANYDSIASAEDATGITRSNISMCLTKKSKSAGGYKWMYYDDYLDLNSQAV